MTGEGLEELREAIEARFLATLRTMDLLVPYDEGGRLSELHELAGEMERERHGRGRARAARVPAGVAPRFERFAVNGATARHERVSFRFTRLTEAAKAPTPAHPGDAGFDLHAAEAARLGPGERASVGTGIAVEIPEGSAGLVLPRSGPGREARDLGRQRARPDRRRLPRRGPRAALEHRPESTFEIAPGDRIAQLVIVAVGDAEPVEAESLSDSARGEGGFGSTGR